MNIFLGIETFLKQGANHTENVLEQGLGRQTCYSSGCAEIVAVWC